MSLNAAILLEFESILKDHHERIVDFVCRSNFVLELLCIIPFIANTSGDFCRQLRGRNFVVHTDVRPNEYVYCESVFFDTVYNLILSICHRKRAFIRRGAADDVICINPISYALFKSPINHFRSQCAAAIGCNNNITTSIRDLFGGIGLIIHGYHEDNRFDRIQNTSAVPESMRWLDRLYLFAFLDELPPRPASPQVTIITEDGSDSAESDSNNDETSDASNHTYVVNECVLSQSPTDSSVSLPLFDDDDDEPDTPECRYTDIYSVCGAFDGSGRTSLPHDWTAPSADEPTTSHTRHYSPMLPNILCPPSTAPTSRSVRSCDSKLSRHPTSQYTSSNGSRAPTILDSSDEQDDICFKIAPLTIDNVRKLPSCRSEIHECRDGNNSIKSASSKRSRKSRTERRAMWYRYAATNDSSDEDTQATSVMHPNTRADTRCSTNSSASSYTRRARLLDQLID